MTYTLENASPDKRLMDQYEMYENILSDARKEIELTRVRLKDALEQRDFWMRAHEADVVAIALKGAEKIAMLDETIRQLKGQVEKTQACKSTRSPSFFLVVTFILSCMLGILGILYMTEVIP